MSGFASPRADQRPPAGRFRLTRRGRAVLLGVALLVGTLTAGLAASAAPAASTADLADPNPAVVAVVLPGDTLWSVAARHVPGRDPFGMIEEIRRLNGLSGNTIHPGQQLRLPAG